MSVKRVGCWAMLPISARISEANDDRIHLVFCQWVEAESFFGCAEKATSRPAWRSDFSGAEQCSAKPRFRPPSVPDADSIPANCNIKVKRHPMKLGGVLL